MCCSFSQYIVAVPKKDFFSLKIQKCFFLPLKRPKYGKKNIFYVKKIFAAP